MPSQVSQALEAVTIARAVRRQLDASRALTAQSFALRAASVGLLDVGRRQVASSRSLVDRARRLCARDAIHPSALPAIRARASGPEDRSTPKRHGCCFSRCAHASRFRPFVALDRGDVRAVVLPLRVCAEHREEVEALLWSNPVRQWLRGKLHQLGQDEPEMVRILFEVVG